MAPVVFDELNLGPDHLYVYTRLNFYEPFMELIDVVFVGGPMGPHRPCRSGMLKHKPGLAVPLRR